MKKKYCYLLLLFSLTHFTFGQVGVGTTTPNGAFEVNSTTQGLVMPRVSLTASNVAAPVVNPNGGALLTGTMVYNTATAGSSPNNVIPGFYFWDGSKWLGVTTQTTASNPDWTILGNTGTTAGTHFIGTTDAVDFVAKTNNTERLRIKSTGNIGVGTTAPSGKLDVTDNNPSGLTRSRFYNAGATSRQDINIGAAGAGNLYLGTDATGSIFGAGIKGYLDNRNGGRMVLGINGNEFFTVATSGNVGVGTIDPVRKLEINSGALGTPSIRLTQQQADLAATSTSGDGTKSLVVDNNGDVVTKINEKRYFPSNCSCTGAFPYTLPADLTTYEQADGNWSGNGIGNTTTADFILPTRASAIAAGHKYGDIVVITRNSGYNVVMGTTNTNLSSNLLLANGTSVGFVLTNQRWYRIF